MPLLKHIRYYKLMYLLAIILLSVSINVVAQIDSSYIRPFDEDFSTRSYFINRIKGFGNNKNAMYNINAPTAIGIGISWKDYSFAFSHGFDILRDKHKGKTKSLEFQYHGYKRKYVYDISLHRHKGFYSESQNNSRAILYPDMQVNMYGGAFMWIFNNKKFSYRAAFNLSEQQLKSAGSFQLGGSVYYTKIKLDRTSSYENLQLGLMGGYAYTRVLSKYWYITGSASVGVNIGNEPNLVFNDKVNLYPILNNRFAAGYNRESWSFIFSSYFNRMYLIIGKNDRISMNDAKFQITILKRFNWDNKFVNKTMIKVKNELNRFGL